MKNPEPDSEPTAHSITTDFSEGAVICIDKPYRWTSFDVVKKLRYQLKIKKIGHAGTLDPLATGLLILCTGKMTKQIDQYQSMEKEYEGVLVLGKTTPSIDLETEIENEKPIDQLTPDLLEKARLRFLGNIQQVPPAHSAIRIQGERAYKMARKGKAVKMEPRTVQIEAFDLTKIELPEVHFRVVCSKGTYIRSLVRDFGNQLAVGAYLSELRRTRIGAFHVKEADHIEDFLARINS